ncbi:MAG: hypothetical protein HYR72_24665 [Deltaproteobacteria bacterium]|nr:hypothetical protein [Deltaproteobacteria bacterium]MBI3389296.1 hypothetical protein [Deltaproteobacteria bacterium]
MEVLAVAFATWCPLVFADAWHVDWRLAAVLLLACGSWAGRRWLPENTAPRPTVELLVAILSVTLITFAAQVALTYPDFIPRQPTPWYYGGLAEQTATAGGYPARSPEWGTDVRFLLDYPYFTSLGAAATRLLRVSLPLPQRMEAFRLFAVLLVAWSAAEATYALTRRIACVFGAGALLFSVHIAGKLAGYRPEAFAYAPLFALLWVCCERLLPLRSDAGDRKGREIAASGMAIIFLLICLLSHGIVAAAAVAALAPLALVSGVVTGHLRSTVLRAGTIMVTSLSLYAAVDLAINRELTQMGNASAPLSVNLPSGDLTFEFYRLCDDSGETTAASALRRLTTKVLPTRFAINDRVKPAWVLIASVASLAAGLLRSRSRGPSLWLVLWAVALGCGGAAFLAFWDTYVPQRIASGRLWPLLAMPVFLVIAIALGESCDLMARLWPRLRASPRGVALGGGLLLMGSLASGVLIPSARFGLRPEDYALLSRARFTASDVVLTNAFAEGSVPTITGGNPFAGGVAAYNKAAALLQHAVDHLREARKFLLQPSRDQACALGFDYILIARKPEDLAAAAVFPTDTDALQRAFTRIDQTPDGALQLYATDCHSGRPEAESDSLAAHGRARL